MPLETYNNSTFVPLFTFYPPVNRADIMKYPTSWEGTIEELLLPETPLERQILLQPSIKEGMDWGEPRYGHPEGKVLYHVREVLDNIDRLSITAAVRSQLRIITLVHDSFKYIEDKTHPRDWTRHHGVLAMEFLKTLTADRTLLKIVKLHDEAYYAWRSIHLFQQPELGQQRLRDLVNIMGSDLQLYYLFFKCDTQTGDKIQTPVKWFETELPQLEVVQF